MSSKKRGARREMGGLYEAVGGGSFTESTTHGDDAEGEDTYAYSAALESKEFNDYHSGDLSAALSPGAAVQKAAADYKLDSLLVKNLMNNNITNFFPVQEMIFPLLFRMSETECVFKRDICVSAPTGSGKTLSYAVPIINNLLCDRTTRKVAGLEALVVLPSRELANQVHNVFCKLLLGSNIKLLCCTGNTSIKEEQSLLFGYYDHNEVSMLSVFSNVDNSFSFSNRFSDSKNNEFSKNNLASKNQDIIINILICTPGRLLEHINQTKNFSLNRLRFMVLDEADRLLGNAYHYWVKSLIESTQQSALNSNCSIDIYDSSNSSSNNSNNSNNRNSSNRNLIGGLKRSFEEMVEASNIVNNSNCNSNSNNNSNSNSSNNYKSSIASESSRKSLQLLLFSATLTDNPRKLGMLGVKNPILLKLNKDSPMYFLPANLTECMRVCDTSERPMFLLAALAEAFNFGEGSIASGLGLSGAGEQNHTINSKHRNLCKSNNAMCLIFASSVETTKRLCRLLQIFNGQLKNENANDVDVNSSHFKSLLETDMSNSYYFKGLVCEMSGDLTATQREFIMSEASKGKIKVLVSSDHLSRGIDLPNCKIVINYDAPKFAKTYVHRVGRTARAERHGHTITLMKKGQQAQFLKMRAEVKAANQLASMAKCKVAQTTLDDIKPMYQKAMEKFKDTLDNDE